MVAGDIWGFRWARGGRDPVLGLEGRGQGGRGFL